jgi:hypothetical protein
MARVAYKGYDLPDGAAIPDVPADLRTLVDGGPVPRFATAAARATAIASPQVGALTYRNDGALYEWWNGSAWTPITRMAPTTRVRGATSVSTTDANGYMFAPLSPPMATFLSVTAILGDIQNAAIVMNRLSDNTVGQTNLVFRIMESNNTPRGSQVVRINWVMVETV